MEDKKEVKKRTTRKKLVEKEEANKEKCKFCGKEFDKGLTICPYCYKKQTSSSIVKYIILAIGLVLCAILIFNFLENYNNNEVSEDYQGSCMYISYEDMVRSPKDNLKKDIAVMGFVTSVEGYDEGYGNYMTITINTNMTGVGNPEEVTITYVDKDYSSGYIVGDTITAYGVYSKINGNTPEIDAKIITINY